MASLSGRAFSQESAQEDIFSGDVGQGSYVGVAKSNNCGCRCEKKLNETIRRLNLLATEEKISKSEFCVKGSRVEVPLLERAAKLFLEDIYFAQKAENLTWIKSVLIRNNLEGEKWEECRKFVLKKTADWRNSLRIKCLTRVMLANSPTYDISPHDNVELQREHHHSFVVAKAPTNNGS